MKKKEVKQKDRTKCWLGTGLIAAVSATLCCIMPLVLFLLGISGAWVSNLTALVEYRPYFLGLAIVLTTIGFWKVYKKPKAEDCAPGTFCSLNQSDTINKLMLWITVVTILLVIVYPYVAPYFLEKL